jgi:hypothetical protein
VSRKGQSITLSIQERDKDQLKAIAAEFGMTWGNEANISQLIKAIARGTLRVAANHDWSLERINALNQARNLLIDAGYIDAALAIAHLLLERGELSIPLKQEIQQFVEQPTVPWRLQIERYIKQQQPFKLSYQDAAERIWNFTIRYAAIVHHEDRQYLDCWCEETEGNQDLPELTHNWSLRLDRIPVETRVIPIKGQWQPSLSQILVEIHLLKGLAFAYRTKTGVDEVNEWHPDLSQVRQVVRRVTSTFWFFREVLRYGEECEIVGPEAVRDRFRQKVRALSALYDA